MQPVFTATEMRALDAGFRVIEATVRADERDKSMAAATGLLTTMDRNMQSAYSEQGSLEIEHQLGRSSTISAGYQHLRGLHLIVSVNQNVPACAAVGTNNGCRPNPNYGNNSQYSSLADSHYDGLHVSFVQRPVKWGDYRVSYAFSKALNNVGENFFSSPVDNFNVWTDYGRSDDDQHPPGRGRDRRVTRQWLEGPLCARRRGPDPALLQRLFWHPLPAAETR
jgi:hypothetical protein